MDDDYENIPPIPLIPEDDRITGRIVRTDIFQFLIVCQKTFWTTEEIDLSKDGADFSRLKPAEQHFLKYVLAFFASSDKIVNINLIDRFIKEIAIPEVEMVYQFQVMIENIHSIVYARLIEHLVPERQEQDRLFNAIRTVPAIKKMTKYMFDTIRSKARFGERLVRMACVEGLFFTGCFCAIFYFANDNNKQLPGLHQSNELIQRDERLHTDFALYLYTLLHPAHKITDEEIYKLIDDAVEIASDFVCEALPEGLAGMNATLMKQYVQHQANNLLATMNMDKLYDVTNPFRFMEKFNAPTKTDFFRSSVTNYAKMSEATGFQLTDDF